MYYLHSRYYDPEVCRFISADKFVSTGQGILGNNMYAYCLNCPTRYCDPSGQYIEEYTITPYKPGGELKGFTVENDERFLDIDYCLGFADELIETQGEDGAYAGMSAKRIALELYAHAELYYYAQSISDPLSSSNAYYSFSTFDNPGAQLSAAAVSFVRSYLIKKGKEITVDNDESAFRMIVFKQLWKRKTGEAYEE